MDKEQLEMSFEGTMEFRRPTRTEQKRSRAQWWFTQMRLVVDRALDWKPAPWPRPVQTYLTLPPRTWS